MSLEILEISPSKFPKLPRSSPRAPILDEVFKQRRAERQIAVVAALVGPGPIDYPLAADMAVAKLPV